MSNISVLGKVWQPKHLDERKIAAIIQRRADMSDVVVKLLVGKNIDIEEIDVFIDPKIKHFLPDPFHLKDMDKGVARIVDAILSNQSICVLGDYDVDGATSSALLRRFFRDIGVDIDVYIPDRILEGYGPSAEIMNKLKQKGIDLVITVDCGASAYDAINAANDIGVNIIVIDHHMMAEAPPQAVAVINPNRLDETSEYGYLAAVGVSFLFVVAICRKLRDIGFWVDKSEPDLLQYIDLVALGTVCDVMPLMKLNRAFVSQGLKILATRQNIGLRTISDLARVDSFPTTYHLGFVIGPRINAGGRVGRSILGSNILSTDSEEEAYKIATELEEYNVKRKEIEQNVLSEATAMADLSNDDNLIFVYGNGWHPGVIGIVAGRLKEKYQKPVAVISVIDGIGKASCRSVKGVDFGSKVVDAKFRGIIDVGGGHAMAAGFTIQEHKLEDLKQFLSTSMRNEYQQFLQHRVSEYDIDISLASLNLDFVSEMSMLGPFGNDNPEPLLCLNNVKIVAPRIVGQKHASCVLINDAQGYGKSKSVKAIAFGAMENALGEFLLTVRSPISLIGYAQINHYNDEQNVQFIIRDVLQRGA